MEAGATHAIVTTPGTVVTAPWTAWKCQYGCGSYGKSYCCPPRTPRAEETREVLDGYERIIFFHLQWTKGLQSGRVIKHYMESVVSLERELFLDGFYRAYALLAGPCTLCKECGLLNGQPCSFPDRARPSMEATGIDVYKTAYNHDLPLSPVRTEQETRNIYCLLLVD